MFALPSLAGEKALGLFSPAHVFMFLNLAAGAALYPNRIARLRAIDAMIGGFVQRGSPPDDREMTIIGAQSEAAWLKMENGLPVPVNPPMTGGRAMEGR